MAYIIKQVKLDEPDNFWRHLYWTGQKWIGHRINTIHESKKYSLPGVKKAIANKTPFDGMELQIEEIE